MNNDCGHDYFVTLQLVYCGGRER